MYSYVYNTCVCIYIYIYIYSYVYNSMVAIINDAGWLIYLVIHILLRAQFP